MLQLPVKRTLVWLLSDPVPRRHTYEDKTESGTKKDSGLQEKRCMSMPSVTSSSSSSTRLGRSRMLRLQDRRFHQKFSCVHPDEHLINYFSCALLQDLLLLQGHLFITNNYFAFYSNIFGHKKEILIPLSDIVKVTKEKTAKIIPNAVGVYTEHDKYIFGSLLSRDTAYRFIQQTWIKSTDAGLVLHEDSESEASPSHGLTCQGDEDSSVSSGLSGHLTSDDLSVDVNSDISPVNRISSREPAISKPVIVGGPRKSKSHFHMSSQTSSHRLTSSCTFKEFLSKVEELLLTLLQLPRTRVLFIISTVLILFLLLSTSILFYRISRVHLKMPVADSWHVDSMARYNQATTVIDRESEVEALILKVQERIKHLSVIRHALEELLVTADVQDVCKALVK